MEIVEILKWPTVFLIFFLVVVFLFKEEWRAVVRSFTNRTFRITIKWFSFIAEAPRKIARNLKHSLDAILVKKEK